MSKFSIAYLAEIKKIEWETRLTKLLYHIFLIKHSPLFKHFIIPFWGSFATLFFGTDKYGVVDDEGGCFDGFCITQIGE